ncbi:hypothetical protein GGTG_08980 [Gaeumannomyces tritici R3-111a-1]|uniref:Uncharacterized protein n=1 Tax=Gaeumannomyces tritici (strain R3-111a-1) TaxID=644352 RepID=J3P639_GAET3|nr:hypothetical protein GGTG_08980 [Gaeumannomyces tritici R3-111a-1]EJT72112.1 hypothetical protein GGTG_08980 [Gaeumannomyces tritici R3-111a-1]
MLISGPENLKCNKLPRLTPYCYKKGFVIARKGSYLGRASLAFCRGFLQILIC